MILEDIYDHMGKWRSLVRKHDANIFDVMFKDVDYWLNEEELNPIIIDVASFFKLSLPEINTHCDVLAKLEINTNIDTQPELFYNWQLLQKSGINNVDAFTLCMVHELAHLYFKGTRFLLCHSERWCHELAADYIVGTYSAFKGISTGKYKYVIKQLQMTPTHPKGEHRVDALEFSRECVIKYSWNDINSSLRGLPAFVYAKQKQLNDEFDQCVGEIKSDLNTDPLPKQIPIEELPDDNLLKQAILQYRNL